MNAQGPTLDLDNDPADPSIADPSVLGDGKVNALADVARVHSDYFDALFADSSAKAQ